MNAAEKSTGIALVKIAPGRRAKFWPECLAGKYICVGWDEVGDLRKYRSKSEFQRTFEKKYRRSLYHGRLSVTRRKANEVWALTKLRPGDKIVANKGCTQVLAVGIVNRPGYAWRPKTRHGDHCHTVSVKWDTSFRKTIPAQPWNQTVVEVLYKVFKAITGHRTPPLSSIRLLAEDAGDNVESKRHLDASRAESRAKKIIEEEMERRAGFQPNPEIRRAVELHAMARAAKEFTSRGFKVKDVSRRKSFDLLCTRRGETKYVEVKGTQGKGFEVALTAGEVKFINQHKPGSVLCVVHGIEVKTGKRANASGGQLSIDDPLDLSLGELAPIAFTYRRR